MAQNRSTHPSSTTVELASPRNDDACDDTLRRRGNTDPRRSVAFALPWPQTRLATICSYAPAWEHGVLDALRPCIFALRHGRRRRVASKQTFPRGSVGTNDDACDDLFPRSSVGTPILDALRPCIFALRHGRRRRVASKQTFPRGSVGTRSRSRQSPVRVFLKSRQAGHDSERVRPRHVARLWVNLPYIAEPVMPRSPTRASLPSRLMNFTSILQSRRNGS